MIGAANNSQRSLIDETNLRLWTYTGYKVGQRLDMQDPQDRAFSRTWLQIFEVLKGFRDRAQKLAWQTYSQTGSPYVLVTERHDGRTRHAGYPSRPHLNVQYTWITEQPDMFRYAAAFDFTTDQQAPVNDTFSTRPVANR